MIIYSLDITLPNLEPVCCSMSSSNCCFLTCTQISQEADRVVCYSHILKKAFLSDQCKEIEEDNRMGKTRHLFKKIRDTKGTFCAKMGTIKDRNDMDLTEAEHIKKRCQEYTELYIKDLHEIFFGFSIQMGISFLSPLAFTSLLFTAICKASSDNHFAFLHFFFLGIVSITASCTMSSIHISSGSHQL